MATETRKSRAPSGVLKKLLAGASAEHAKIELPRAIHEIRVSVDPEDIIPAGTVITEEIADAAGFDDDTVKDLFAKGAIDYVEVFAQAADAGDGDDASQAD